MAYYFSCALDPKNRKKIIAEAVARLRKVEFDAIAFTGGSGAAIAPIVAYMLSKELIVVRKVGQTSHHGPGTISTRTLEGRYIFLDDFYSGGDTAESTIARLAAFSSHLSCVGLYFYKPGNSPLPAKIAKYPVFNREVKCLDNDPNLIDRYVDG